MGQKKKRALVSPQLLPAGRAVLLFWDPLDVQQSLGLSGHSRTAAREQEYAGCTGC